MVRNAKNFASGDQTFLPGERLGTRLVLVMAFELVDHSQIDGVPLGTDPDIGDHIRTLGFIDHHMLVVKVVDSCHLRVIHYTTNDEKGTNSSDGMVLAAAAACPSLLGSAGEVKEEVIEVDLAKDRHEMLEYPPGVALHTGEDAIDRARLKLKEKEYNGFSNNCESLVNWAITGKKQTNQGDTASQLAGGLLTVGVLGAIAFAVTAVLAGRKNNNN